MGMRRLGQVGVGDRLTDYISCDVEVRQVASGGFGVVYLGPDRLADGRWRALKTLRSDVLARSRRAADLFVREGLTWAGLWPHANILTAWAVTRINGQPFLVLDYAEGGNLREALKRGWLRWQAALFLAQQISARLVALHTPDPSFLRPHPIVHRDLKPENVLLNEHGLALITDFGLAKVVAEGLGADLDTVLDEEESSNAAGTTQIYRTARGKALGTPAYMAPEQWVDAASAEPPVDIYAFGLILGELLTGRHPLLDLELLHSMEVWQEAHRVGQPRPLASLAAQPAAPPDADMLVALAEVEGVYQACLRKQAEARPGANEVLARLQQAASRLGQTPYTPTEVYPHTPEHEMIAWHNWVSTYYSFGLYEEALERNDRAVALAPTNPDMLIERGDILAALNRQEEALTVYDTALAALPPDEVMLRTSLWNNRGARLHELMRYAEAEASFAQALALLPTDADAWCNRGENQRLWGRAEAQAGHFDAALFHWRTGIKYVEHAITINSHHPKYHQVLDLLRDAPGSGGGQ